MRGEPMLAAGRFGSLDIGTGDGGPSRSCEMKNEWTKEAPPAHGPNPEKKFRRPKKVVSPEVFWGLTIGGGQENDLRRGGAEPPPRGPEGEQAPRAGDYS